MVCVTCGASFTAAHPAKNTCSHACDEAKKRAATARYRQRVREARKAPRAEQFCSLCGQTKPAAAFGLNRARVGGLQNYCKSCRADYAQRPDQREKDRLRKHIWYLVNYDRQRQRFRQRFERDPVFRWQVLQSNRARYHADPKRHYDRQREREREQKRWETMDQRRCFCGRALPAEGERWFCRPRCKIKCASFVCGLGQSP